MLNRIFWKKRLHNEFRALMLEYSRLDRYYRVTEQDYNDFNAVHPVHILKNITAHEQGVISILEGLGYSREAAAKKLTKSILEVRRAAVER